MTHKKLALALGAALTMAVSANAFSGQPDSTRVIVKYKPGARAQAESALRAAGGKLQLQIQGANAFAANVSPHALNGLAGNPNIEYVEADVPRYLSGQTTPYGIDKVQAPTSWAVGADGTGVKVCVIDSGINAAHEDFAGVALTGYPTGWNTDNCGHGTHVAGTINAVNNTTGVVGVSPGKVALHIVKVFGNDTVNNCAWSYSSTLVDAANRCDAAGAKIISMSLGGGAKSRTEETTFASLYNKGILSIAAAGNDGNNRMSYPASYPSVVSVAAVDSNNAWASFSQYNSAVDIAAPGVGVLSTYPIIDASLTVAGTGYTVSAIEGTPQTSATGATVNGGRCTSAGAWAGKVVLCERGDISFADKVNFVSAGGGVAAVIYNNAPGGFAGTLSGVATSIPSVSASQEDGQYLIANALGQSATVSTITQSGVSGYAYLDGTSMATPHVSGVAALVWSANPAATNAQVLNAMTSTALDLDVAGRDNKTGYGLVQSYQAVQAIK